MIITTVAEASRAFGERGPGRRKNCQDTNRQRVIVDQEPVDCLIYCQTSEVRHHLWMPGSAMCMHDRILSTLAEAAVVLFQKVEDQLKIVLDHSGTQPRKPALRRLRLVIAASRLLISSVETKTPALALLKQKLQRSHLHRLCIGASLQQLQSLRHDGSWD
ncbi:MAG: hypothetical protein ACFCUR_14910 [Rhodomicrobiaceae bacterium]